MWRSPATVVTPVGVILWTDLGWSTTRRGAPRASGSSLARAQTPSPRERRLARATGRSPARPAPGAGQDQRAAPRVMGRDFLVHRQTIGGQSVPLGLEGAVAEGGVVAGQGAVAQRVEQRGDGPLGVLVGARSAVSIRLQSAVGVRGRTCSMVSPSSLRSAVIRVLGHDRGYRCTHGGRVCQPRVGDRPGGGGIDRRPA